MASDATEKWAGGPRRRLYLMRHGEVDYFDPDGRPYRPAEVPLNAEGRRQAQAAGRALAHLPLDRVISSGLPRSVETASLAAAGRDLPLESRPELREIEPGRLSALEAIPGDVIERAFLGALAGLDRDRRFLGGETFGALLDRVRPCFHALLADPGWRHLLLVAHGVVNRVILADVLGAGLGALGSLEQDEGCINLIEVDDRGHGLVRVLNCTPANPLKAGVDTTSLERLYLQYRRGRRPGPRSP